MCTLRTKRNIRQRKQLLSTIWMDLKPQFIYIWSFGLIVFFFSYWDKEKSELWLAVKDLKISDMLGTS